jgi:hypothetical protein
MPATSRKAAPEDEVYEWASELADLELKYLPSAKDEARRTELDALIKQAMKDQSRRITLEGKGVVKIAGPHDADEKPDAPAVNEKKWTGLTDAERRKELKRGLITMKPQVARAFPGRVTFEPFRISAN